MVVQDLLNDKKQGCTYKIKCSDPTYQDEYNIPHKYVTSDKTQNAQITLGKMKSAATNIKFPSFISKKESSGGMKTEKKRKNGKNKTFSKKTRN